MHGQQADQLVSVSTPEPPIRCGYLLVLLRYPPQLSPFLPLQSSPLPLPRHGFRHDGILLTLLPFDVTVVGIARASLHWPVVCLVQVQAQAQPPPTTRNLQPRQTVFSAAPTPTPRHLSSLPRPPQCSGARKTRRRPPSQAASLAPTPRRLAPPEAVSLETQLRLRSLNRQVAACLAQVLPHNNRHSPVVCSALRRPTTPNRSNKREDSSVNPLQPHSPHRQVVVCLVSRRSNPPPQGAVCLEIHRSPRPLCSEAGIPTPRQPRAPRAVCSGDSPTLEPREAYSQVLASPPPNSSNNNNNPPQIPRLAQP